MQNAQPLGSKFPPNRTIDPRPAPFPSPFARGVPQRATRQGNRYPVSPRRSVAKRTSLRTSRPGTVANTCKTLDLSAALFRRPQQISRSGGSMSSARQKIAVIGGGVGAMTAVYAITTIPGWNSATTSRCISSAGAAAARGPRGAMPPHHQRIEEHGLSYLAGFYENAFRLMRDCYDTMNKTGLRDPRRAAWHAGQGVQGPVAFLPGRGPAAARRVGQPASLARGLSDKRRGAGDRHAFAVALRLFPDAGRHRCDLIERGLSGLRLRPRQPCPAAGLSRDPARRRACPPPPHRPFTTCATWPGCWIRPHAPPRA